MSDKIQISKKVARTDRLHILVIFVIFRQVLRSNLYNCFRKLRRHGIIY